MAAKEAAENCAFMSETDLLDYKELIPEFEPIIQQAIDEAVAAHKAENAELRMKLTVSVWLVVLYVAARTLEHFGWLPLQLW